MPTIGGVGFIGRTHERERLDVMLAQARDGQSAVVVIRGEPGIGKTALLRYAARQASGLRTTEVEGVQAEMELPFAGIHRLCAPMFDGIEVLAEPQQNALRVALGVASGDAPDKFLVAVAVLNLLSATAEQRPLLCLVDDAQWLDVASMQALGFVARRLVAEPMAMIFSLREPTTTRALDGLPQLSLDGLDEPDARDLLSRAVPGRLDDRVRDRIIVETRGNPLALIELSQRMSPVRASRGLCPTGAERSSESTGGALPAARRRIARRDAATHPASGSGAAGRRHAAVAGGRATLHPTLARWLRRAEAGLLEIDDRVRFHHPLVRSAVYRAASPDERRRVHDVLAEVSDPELAADRRAWHRALAAAEPDEAVAADLERSAGRAQESRWSRGRCGVPRAGDGSDPGPGPPGWARAGGGGGELPGRRLRITQRLLATAESGPLDGFQRARAALLRGPRCRRVRLRQRGGLVAPRSRETPRAVRPQPRAQGLPDRFRCRRHCGPPRWSGRPSRGLPRRARPPTADLRPASTRPADRRLSPC